MRQKLAKILAGSTAPKVLPPSLGLFLTSFASLFVELLLIRWVPSVIRIVAFYSNLMLVSSFLGLGCGILLARKRSGLYRLFGPLLLVLVALVAAFQGTELATPGEVRFVPGAQGTIAPVILVFVVNALVFVPLGELTAIYLKQLPPLQAYSWDLGGAIAGTLLFGFFSYFWFSPILGMAVVMAVYLIFCGRRSQLIMTCVFFLPIVLIMATRREPGVIWSPYNHIEVVEAGLDGVLRPVSSPPARLTVMRDPPFYLVLVNRITYMLAGTIDPRRYTDPGRSQLDLLGLERVPLLSFAELYAVPHLVRRGAKDVLVVGSGAGVDVEAALLYGARHVDAVEIDPAIIRMGRRYSASASYKDPRVTVYNTDARAFFRQAAKRYDLVVFGFLDSQSLFSQMSNIRLDGYVYTQESLREAFGLVRQGGLLALSFFPAGNLWLLDRLASMVRSATGTAPLVYAKEWGQVVILAGKGFVPEGPARFIDYQKTTWNSLGTPEATDDWPYLYLSHRFIPRHYLINVAALLSVSLALILLSSTGGKKAVDGHFFFLGSGFLLLETKSITTISLYFGTTWLVSMIVILGVLLMILVANWVATLTRAFLPRFYLLLLASVLFLYLFPVDYILAWPFWGRFLYSVIVIPLPIFFAGLIFSTTFRESPDPSLAFGSNLIGAMVGGFCEYLGMVTGMKALLLVVLVFYLASALIRLRVATPRPGRPEVSLG